MTNMELVGALLSSPRTAFAELRERPRFLLPMLVLLLGTAGALFWYFSIVDFAWLQDQMLNSNPRLAQMTEEQRARAAAAMSQNFIMWSSILAGTVGMVIFLSLEAAYYTLASKITNVACGYKHWFAFAWWINLPSAISIAGMVLFLLLQDGSQVASQELQLLSLNELFFHRTTGEPGHMLLSTLTIIHPWIWWLAVTGVQAWSGRSWLFSTVFALLPSALIYGCWAVIAFVL